MIENNRLRKPKALFTNKPETEEPVAVLELSSDGEEARWVAEQIKAMRESGEYDANDIAVLYRTNAQSRNFEDALRYYQIPYKTVGGIAFYQRAEIKDMLAYLSLLVNARDDLSFLRVVNTPKRGIGPAALAKLGEFAEFKGWSLYETVEHLDEVATLSSAQKNRFRAFLELMQKLGEIAERSTLKETIEAIYDLTGYREMVMTGSDQVRAKTIDENVGELVTAASDYDRISPETGADLSLFLENAALSSSAEESAEDGQISLMTLHSAKGLEFPVVFLTGLEENLFPSVQSVSNNDIEEERRLCYVGITRAMEKLYITRADSRRVFGQERRNMASTFITELPDEGVLYYAQESDGSLVESEGKPRKRDFKGLFESGKPPKKEESGTFMEGDRVTHETYGLGMIIQKKEKYCKIAFPGKGIVKLDYNFIKKYDG